MTKQYSSDLIYAIHQYYKYDGELDISKSLEFVLRDSILWGDFQLTGDEEYLNILEEHHECN